MPIMVTRWGPPSRLGPQVMTPEAHPFYSPEQRRWRRWPERCCFLRRGGSSAVSQRGSWSGALLGGWASVYLSGNQARPGLTRRTRCGDPELTGARPGRRRLPHTLPTADPALAKTRGASGCRGRLFPVGAGLALVTHSAWPARDVWDDRGLLTPSPRYSEAIIKSACWLLKSQWLQLAGWGGGRC